MKAIFLMAFIFSGTVFSATTDVCVIDKVTNNSGSMQTYFVQGYSDLCIVDNGPFFKTPNEQVVAKCSDRSDNAAITFNQIKWSLITESNSCSSGTTPYKVSVVSVTSEAQARADVLAQLYQKGYVLFDHATMLRTR